MNYLDTQRLYLKEFEIGDAHLLYDLDSDPMVTKYVGGQLETMQEYEDNIKTYIDNYKKKKNCGFYKAYLKENDLFIGWFCICPEHSDPENYKVLELGYRIKQQYWNKGYATEGSKSLINKAFTELDADTVSAMAYFENEASFKVMEKSGMGFSNEIMFMDKYKVYRYALNKQDWQKV